MGMFDSFYSDDNQELQLKAGECCLNEFHIGDAVSDFGYKDGVYKTSGGYIVILDGVFKAVLPEDCFWYRVFDFVVFVPDGVFFGAFGEGCFFDKKGNPISATDG